MSNHDKYLDRLAEPLPVRDQMSIQCADDDRDQELSREPRIPSEMEMGEDDTIHDSAGNPICAECREHLICSLCEGSGCANCGNTGFH